MFDVLISVEEKLSSVKLNQYAGHRPDITLLIPYLVLKNYLGSSVLSGIDNQGMSFVGVSGSAKINQLNLCRERSMPLSHSRLAAGVLAREVAGIIDVTASLRAIDTSLILHLLSQS